MNKCGLLVDRAIWSARRKSRTSFGGTGQDFQALKQLLVTGEEITYSNQSMQNGWLTQYPEKVLSRHSSIPYFRNCQTMGVSWESGGYLD